MRSETSLVDRARDKDPHPQSHSGRDRLFQSSAERNRLEEVYSRYQTAEKNRAWQASAGTDFLWEKLLDEIRPYVGPVLGKKIKILEIGCSAGGSLKSVGEVFRDPELYGVDIRTAPLVDGKKKYPELELVGSDAACLPFPDNTFDMSFQFFSLSSVLRSDLRKRIAEEMLRVTKDGGFVISLDLRIWSPNRNVVSISKPELKQLFRDSRQVTFRSAWLLPPLYRRIANRALLGTCYFFPFLRSHWLLMARR